MVGFQPPNHNKQKCKMFPNNNHELVQTQKVSKSPKRNSGSERRTTKSVRVESDSDRTSPSARLDIPQVASSKAQLLMMDSPGHGTLALPSVWRADMAMVLPLAVVVARSLEVVLSSSRILMGQNLGYPPVNIPTQPLK